MFSGLSKLIFGDASTHPEIGKPEHSSSDGQHRGTATPACDHPSCQAMVEEEDGDWVVLCNMENKPAEVLMVDTVLPTSSDSAAVTPGLSTPPTPMEGSWTLAPPPCFVSSPDSACIPECSPLENLLIEHPSMSVYVPLQTMKDRTTPNYNPRTKNSKSHPTPSNKCKKVAKRKPCSAAHSAGSAANRLRAAQIRSQKQCNSRLTQSQKCEKRKADSTNKLSTKPLSNRVLTIRDRNNNSPSPTYSQSRHTCKRHV